VDVARRVVTISEHKTVHNTGTPRIFAITETAARIVTKQRGRHPKFVFTNYANEPYTEDGLGSIMQQHHCPVYRLRHTWCQRATEANLPDGVILKQMGHESSQMLKMYRRISETQLLAASGLFDGLSQAPRPADIRHRRGRSPRGDGPRSAADILPPPPTRTDSAAAAVRGRSVVTRRKSAG
jgi:hypothetical protein